MDFRPDPEVARFRETVRSFLAESLPEEFADIPHEVVAPTSIFRPWQRILQARGWAAPTWAKEHGGAGWTLEQQLVWEEERVRARAPLQDPFAQKLIGPVLNRFATPEQWQEHVPPILLPASLAALAPAVRALTCFPFSTQVGLYAAGPTEYDREFSDDALVFTGKLLAEFSNNVNGYLSYSRGNKAGGFNLDSTAASNGADPSFRPEKVTSYEAGIKTQFLDRALTANLAVFYQEFTDFQVLDFTGVQYTTFNVPKAETKGFELELIARPSREFTFNGSLTYADAGYPEDCGGAAPPTQVATLCGSSLTLAPELVAIAGFDYSREIGGGLRVGLNGSVRMESDRRTTTQPILAVAAGSGTISLNGTNNYILSPFDVQDGSVKVNARATIGSADGGWSLEVVGHQSLQRDHLRRFDRHAAARHFLASGAPQRGRHQRLARGVPARTAHVRRDGPHHVLAGKRTGARPVPRPRHAT